MAKAFVVIVLLATASFVTCNPVAQKKEATKDWIIKCLDMGNFMPAINTSSGEYACYALTTRGPCNKTEWFVLKENAVEAECVPRRCSIVDVYYKDNCFGIGTTSKCGQGMELLPNLYGEGECECKEGYLLYKGNGTEAPRCEQEYLQGPCPEKQQITNVEDEGVCKDNDCPPNQIRWEGGPCIDNLSCDDEDYQVTFDEEQNNLACTTDTETRSLLVVPTDCDDGKSLDSNADCVGISGDSSRRSPRLAKSKDSRKLLKGRL